MTGAVPFPRARWVAAVWLAVWIPAYLWGWGWRNFLQLCDVAVILTCVGLWRGSALLLSSQALASIVVDTIWSLDAAWRVTTGHHLMGGTQYMWDARFPLTLRLLSLFHPVWPVLLIWSLRRVGYDRRALRLQAALTVPLFVLSRIFGEAKNINYVFQDPFLGRAWGPAPAHVALAIVLMVALVYLPTHRALARALPAAGPGRG